jgi:SOS-response transcriptional repressor LexA
MIHELLDQVYDYIVSTIQTVGYPPSIREIADACYLSPGAVQRCLDLLEARGRILRTPGKARGIKLLETEES